MPLRRHLEGGRGHSSNKRPCTRSKEPLKTALSTARLLITHVSDSPRQSALCLLGTISGDKLRQPSSDEFWAAHWISDRDEMQLAADDPYLAQRYALAVVYYALNLDQHFADSGSGGERWLDGQSECSWAGIRCDVTWSIGKVTLSIVLQTMWVWGCACGGVLGNILILIFLSPISIIHVVFFLLKISQHEGEG